MKTNQTVGRIALAAACVLASTGLHAEESPWMIRVRALLIDPVHKSDAIGALGVPADAIEVERRWTPELDISYFFSKQLAAELVLAYTRLNVKVNDSALGGFDAGSFRALPPTLTLQWHFMPDATFRPYVGAGLNYTRISNVKLSVPTTPAIPLSLERTSIGAALQAGFDVKLDGPWSVNVDIKKVWIGADVKDSTGARVTTVKLNPVLFGIGVGYRF